MTLKNHPYANLFPMIEGPEFDAFAGDLKANGQREKIVLLGGLILDGRNRYAAAVLHDLPAAHGDPDCFRDFDPEKEGPPLEFVLSANLRRRHLDESQRAMVGDSLANMRQGERNDLEPSANLPKVDQATAAAALQVSTRLVGSARLVREKGSPELVKLVEQGKMAVSAAANAAKLGPDEQARVVALVREGKGNAVRTAIKQGARNNREAALGQKQVALPDKKYGVILADPEHRFEVWSRETGLDRSPDNHYPTSEQRMLLMREIPKISAKDCVCGLWVTDLARGIRILESWGFEFKSYAVWVKDIVEGPRNEEGRRTYVEIGAAGTGYWFRDRDELFLIGTRGDVPCPAMGTQGESVWFSARPKIEGTERGKHSAKPEDAHLWFEKHFPHLPKIELNARLAREGWDSWGNEAPDDAGNNLLQNITENISDSIPQSATEAAAIDDVELDIPQGGVPHAFRTDDAEAEDKRSGPEPTPQTSASGVTGGERATTSLLSKEPRWRDQVATAPAIIAAEPAISAPKVAPASAAKPDPADSFEIPSFLLRTKPGAGT